MARTISLNPTLEAMFHIYKTVLNQETVANHEGLKVEGYCNNNQCNSQFRQNISHTSPLAISPGYSQSHTLIKCTQPINDDCKYFGKPSSIAHCN